MSHRIPPSFDDGAILPIEAPRWYAVYTGVRCEKRAEQAIREALRVRLDETLEVYLPSLVEKVKHARQEEWVEKPLFLRYLFVCIRGEDMHLVRDSDGVQDFVRAAGGMPAPIHPRFVLKFKRAQERGAFDPRAKPEPPPFPIGSKVLVRVGTFSDRPAKVLRMTPKRRVEVLLSAFGRDHIVEVEPGDLDAA